MKITERYEIHRMSYPFAKKLNPIIHDIILKNATIPDKGAIMTRWDRRDIKEFSLIFKWVEDFLIGVSQYQRENLTLELNNLWGQLYNKGDYQDSHDHLPCHWSFVYYVNTPRGSSPLVFEQSKTKLHLKEGEVIIFPAWIRHYVPPNRCEERSIVAGNISYVKKGT